MSARAPAIGGITKQTLFPFDYVSRQLKLTVLGTRVFPVRAFGGVISNVAVPPPGPLGSRIPVRPNFVSACNLHDSSPHPCIIQAVINVSLNSTHIFTEKPINKEGLYCRLVRKLYFLIFTNMHNH